MSATETLVRAELRYRWAKRILIILACMATIAMLGLLLFNSITARAARMDQNVALRLLVECTTPPSLRVPSETDVPSSDCYLRNQRSSAAIIGDPPAPVNTVVILAAACADRPGITTRDDIYECVVEGLG